MDGGLVHQSEGRVTQAVIAALALASLVLQSGGSTPLADTTLNNVLKGYGEKVSPRFTDRTSSRPAASRTESLGRCSSPSARPAYISFVLRKSRLLANDLREGELGTVDFMSEVERIKQLPPPHNRWITIWPPHVRQRHSPEALVEIGAVRSISAAKAGLLALDAHFHLCAHLGIHCCRRFKAWFEPSRRGHANRVSHLHASRNSAYQRLHRYCVRQALVCGSTTAVRRECRILHYDRRCGHREFRPVANLMRKLWTWPLF